MSHRRAVLAMIGVTLLWSIAGVVTRQLEGARSFEITFWRSAFNAAALIVALAALRGPSALAANFARGGAALWLSGLCWAVMFTAFMVALTLTTVANVLVTMALGPLFTALLASRVLRQRLPLRTWAAIVVAGIGIGWMQAGGVAGGAALLGSAVALAVPLAAAVNWIVLQRHAGVDLLPAVLLGALLSAAATLPLALPFAASAHDIGWLAVLGLLQLALPCLLAVVAARTLPAPEIALLSLLEVVFGVAWAWLGAGEAPAPAVLGGGSLVLAALAANQTLALRQGRSQARAAPALPTIGA